MGPYAPQQAPAAPRRDPLAELSEASEAEGAKFIEEFRKAVLTDVFWPSFEKEPLLQEGVLPGVKDFLDLDSLLTILVRGQESSALAAYKHGDRYMRDALFLAYLDGATICLSHAETFLPHLLALCQDLAGSFDYVTARCVLQPPNAPPAPMRWEQRDSIILQIWGEQQWFLAPMASEGQSKEQKLPPRCLKPGDVLYVPRSCGTTFVGSIHNADKCFGRGGVSMPRSSEPKERPNNHPSVHVELALRTQERSWGYLLANYLGDLLRDGSLQKDVDNFCRSACHKRLVGGQDGAESLDKRLHEAADDLAGRVDSEGLRRYFAQKMERLRKEQIEQSKQTKEIPVPPDLVRTYSNVRVAGDVECSCKPGDTVALFKRGSDTLRLPIAQSASGLVSDLSDSRPHKIADLTCDDPFEALCVCQVLIEKECLEVQTPPSPDQ